MNEAEWNCCDDPLPMLRYLRDKASRRKLLLFLCACYRRVWHLSAATETGKRNLIEVVERYAEGQATNEQIVTAGRVVARAERRDSIRLLSEANWKAWVTEDVAWEEVEAGVWRARYGLACDHGERARPNEDSWKAQSQAHRAWAAAELKERRGQAALLRDLFGSLLFREVCIDPAWLSWNASTVVKMAQTVYKDRHLPEGTLDRMRLCVLADGLEEAGCTNQDILLHCRSGEDHVRGCWVVDLLLDKS